MEIEHGRRHTSSCPEKNILDVEDRIPEKDTERRYSEPVDSTSQATSLDLNNTGEITRHHTLAAAFMINDPARMAQMFAPQIQLKDERDHTYIGMDDVLAYFVKTPSTKQSKKIHGIRKINAIAPRVTRGIYRIGRFRKFIIIETIWWDEECHATRISRESNQSKGKKMLSFFSRHSSLESFEKPLKSSTDIKKENNILPQYPNLQRYQVSNVELHGIETFSKKKINQLTLFIVSSLSKKVLSKIVLYKHKKTLDWIHDVELVLPSEGLTSIEFQLHDRHPFHSQILSSATCTIESLPKCFAQQIKISTETPNELANKNTDSDNSNISFSLIVRRVSCLQHPSCNKNRNLISQFTSSNALDEKVNDQSFKNFFIKHGLGSFNIFFALQILISIIVLGIGVNENL